MHNKPLAKPWNVKLNNGAEIPILGLGTYKAFGNEVRSILKKAIDVGYRHFDTADYYQVRVVVFSIR